MADSSRHWDRIAQSFHLWAPPLRPSPEDVAVIRRAGGEVFQAQDHSLQVVLWGVTPEIATLDWPVGTYLTAVDRSAGMIREVWPGDQPGIRRALRADWRETPRLLGVPADMLVGDGCFNTMDFPEEWDEYLEVAIRSVRAGGRLVVRFFVQAPRRQEPEEVVRDLQEGRVTGFHAFKILLVMAVQGDSDRGARLADVWQVWDAYRKDVLRGPAARGWPPGIVETIELYRDRPDRFWFPTFEEIAALFRRRVSLLSVAYPSYEMGDRCPSAVFEVAGGKGD